MESRNAEFLREGLIDTARKMSPLERLDAFVKHSLRLRNLMALGEKRRMARARSNQSQSAESELPDSLRLLSRIGSVLDEYGADWAAVGMMAIAYHGWVRGDLVADALISLKKSSIDLDQLADRLRTEGWSPEVRMGEPGDPLGFVVRIKDSHGNQADLIGGIRKLDSGFFDRILREEWDGAPLKFASVEDLLALKFFAGGPLDLEDAEALLKIRGGSIDKALVSGLSKAFGRRAAEACERALAKFP